MSAPDRRQAFKPLIFPRFEYTEAETKPLTMGFAQGIDYKAAYELKRLDCMRLAQMGMQLVDALSKYAPEPFKTELAKAKTDLGKALLEM